MKSWVVLLSINVAVSSVLPSTVIFIFSVSLLSGDFSVGGTAVDSAAVGGAFVGVKSSAVGVGDETAGDEARVGDTGTGRGDVGVDAGTQAAIKTAAMVNMML